MAQGTLNDEKELTETELRRLNQKHLNETQDMDDLLKPVGIHHSNQDHARPDHSIEYPTMFARDFGMMPSSNRMMPGAMSYPGQLQSLYGPQIYPGDPVFARFNMNELTRGGGAPMVPDMIGMPHPSMTMNTRAPAQFRQQEIQTAAAAARGVAPVATKGKVISIFYQVFFYTHPSLY